MPHHDHGNSDKSDAKEKQNPWWFFSINKSNTIYWYRIKSIIAITDKIYRFLSGVYVIEIESVMVITLVSSLTIDFALPIRNTVQNYIAVIFPFKTFTQTGHWFGEFPILRQMFSSLNAIRWNYSLRKILQILLLKHLPSIFYFGKVLASFCLLPYSRTNKLRKQKIPYRFTKIQR